jgi:hypothetical protein
MVDLARAVVIMGAAVVRPADGLGKGIRAPCRQALKCLNDNADVLGEV